MLNTKPILLSCLFSGVRSDDRLDNYGPDLESDVWRLHHPHQVNSHKTEIVESKSVM